MDYEEKAMQTELGRKLVAIRQRAIENGLVLKSSQEIDDEIAGIDCPRWQPIETAKTPPKGGQRVFYFLEPFSRWYVGEWCAEDETFHSRSGFCDKYDAPYWHPEPPSPQERSEAE